MNQAKNQLILWAFIDIETTGVNEGKDEVIDIGWYRFEGEKLQEKFTSLVYSSRPIPLEIETLTGISSQLLENAPKLEELKDNFRTLKNHLLFAHNSDFEKKFLTPIFQRLFPEETIDVTFVDSIPILSLLHPWANKLGLEYFIQELGLRTFEIHRGLADAKDLGACLLGSILQLKKSKFSEEFLQLLERFPFREWKLISFLWDFSIETCERLLESIWERPLALPDYGPFESKRIGGTETPRITLKETKESLDSKGLKNFIEETYSFSSEEQREALFSLSLMWCKAIIKEFHHLSFVSNEIDFLKAIEATASLFMANKKEKSCYVIFPSEEVKEKEIFSLKKMEENFQKLINFEKLDQEFIALFLAWKIRFHSLSHKSDSFILEIPVLLKLYYPLFFLWEKKIKENANWISPSSFQLLSANSFLKQFKNQNTLQNTLVFLPEIETIEEGLEDIYSYSFSHGEWIFSSEIEQSIELETAFKEIQKQLIVGPEKILNFTEVLLPPSLNHYKKLFFSFWKIPEDKQEYYVCFLNFHAKSGGVLWARPMDISLFLKEDFLDQKGCSFIGITPYFTKNENPSPYNKGTLAEWIMSYPKLESGKKFKEEQNVFSLNPSVSFDKNCPYLKITENLPFHQEEEYWPSVLSLLEFKVGEGDENIFLKCSSKKRFQLLTSLLPTYYGQSDYDLFKEDNLCIFSPNSDSKECSLFFEKFPDTLIGGYAKAKREFLQKKYKENYGEEFNWYYLAKRSFLLKKISKNLQFKYGKISKGTTLLDARAYNWKKRVKETVSLFFTEYECLF